MADAVTENSANKQAQQREINKRKRQKMSKVWDHFKLKIKDNIVVCVHCKTELAYHNSTTSMLQHLKRKHPFDDKSGRPETQRFTTLPHMTSTMSHNHTSSKMADYLVGEFRAQLNTALESVLRKAALEIMVIFESSIHDHQKVLTHKDEEVAHLKIKLQAAEMKLKGCEFGGDRGVETNESEPNPEVNPYGQTADVPEDDIEVPDDWCAPLGDETTNQPDYVCPSVKLRQLLIPLCRIPVIKQEEVNCPTVSHEQRHGYLTGSLINNSHKNTQTILPVYKQEMQWKTLRSHQKKWPQENKQDNYDQTASIGLRRRGRCKNEKEQKCTATSSRGERGHAALTTEEMVEKVKIYTCKVCKKGFDKDSSLRLHSLIHMRCNGCRKVFSFRGSLKFHERLCKKFEKVLRNRANNKMMLMTKRDGYTKMYNCPYCLKTCSSIAKYISHMRVHDPKNKFACSLCPKKFSSNAGLKNHKRVHQDQKNYAETNGDMAWTMPLEETEEALTSPSKDSGQ